MNDKELADAVVALGVGNKYTHTDDVSYYKLGADSGTYVLDGMFVRDWRVAGALMEKCHQFEVRIFGFKIAVGDAMVDNPETPSELPRAIIEACVEALT